MPGLLFGLLLVLSGAALALWAHRLVRRYSLAQKWRKVPAVVLKSEVRVSEDSDGKSFVPEFRYSYSVDGIGYESSVHTHGQPLNGDREQIARKLVQSFPAGQHVSIAVNPEDPTSAILDTGVPELWIVVRRFCFVLVAVGILILLFAAARIDA
jgi:hypothetical protein